MSGENKCSHGSAQNWSQTVNSTSIFKLNSIYTLSLFFFAHPAFAELKSEPPPGYTYETTGIHQSVGSLNFIIPANFMHVYHPNLYLEATFPNFSPVSAENSECFRHQDTCPDLLRALLLDVPSKQSNEIFKDIGLDKLKSHENPQINLREIESKNKNVKYYFNFDSDNDVLISCYLSKDFYYVGECSFHRKFKDKSLQVSFRYSRLAEWENIQDKIIQNISRFEAP